MGRTIRFFFRTSLINLGVILAFAALVTLGAIATDASGLFETYFSLFPAMGLMILFMLSYALCTSQLNIALSFGARRKDYFPAMHINMVYYAAAVTLLQQVMLLLSQSFGWQDREGWRSLLTLGGQPILLFFLLCLLLQMIGGACGLLMIRSRAVGLVIMACVTLFAIASVVFLMLTATHGAGSWGDLPWILYSLLLLLAAGSEVFMWKTIQSYCVR